MIESSDEETQILVKEREGRKCPFPGRAENLRPAPVSLRLEGGSEKGR